MITEQLLTKCCWTVPVTDDNYAIAEETYCPQCKRKDPHMEWVEMCDGCKRPGRYCECP